MTGITSNPNLWHGQSACTSTEIHHQNTALKLMSLLHFCSTEFSFPKQFAELTYAWLCPRNTCHIFKLNYISRMCPGCPLAYLRRCGRSTSQGYGSCMLPATQARRLAGYWGM